MGRKFQINPGPLKVVDTSGRLPGEGRGVQPKPIAFGRSRYGCGMIEPGLYMHPSGALVVRTDAWEGPRGGSLSRWEIASYDAYGNVSVGDDGRLFDSMLSAVEALDRGPYCPACSHYHVGPCLCPECGQPASSPGGTCDRPHGR